MDYIKIYVNKDKKEALAANNKNVQALYMNRI